MNDKFCYELKRFDIDWQYEKEVASSEGEYCKSRQAEKIVDTLRRENAEKDRQIADLKAREEEVSEALDYLLNHAGNWEEVYATVERLLTRPTPGASARLKEQAIKEEEEFQGFRISYAHGSTDALPEVVMLESVKDGTILKYEPSARLKEQHYRECLTVIDIILAALNNHENPHRGERKYRRACFDIRDAILQKLEGK